MIWSLRIGDIIKLENDTYHYEVKDVFSNLITLENVLTHDKKEVKLSDIRETATVIRRNDL